MGWKDKLMGGLLGVYSVASITQASVELKNIHESDLPIEQKIETLDKVREKTAERKKNVEDIIDGMLNPPEEGQTHILPDNNKRERKNKNTKSYSQLKTDDPPKNEKAGKKDHSSTQKDSVEVDDPPKKKDVDRSGAAADGSRFTADVDSKSGTIIQKGELNTQKGDHKHMPKRTNAYLPDDERGHIQASSLGGDNSKNNVVPQSKDLNHGAYYQMELGEKDALEAKATIESEKIAYSSGGPGSRPDAFMVNDTITRADGKVDQVHLSFANLSNKEQESHEKTASEHTDMLGEPDYKSMGVSKEEYNALMDESEDSGINVRDEYAPSGESVNTDKQPTKKTPKKEAAQADDGQSAEKSKRAEPEKPDEGNGTKTPSRQEEKEADPADNKGNGSKPNKEENNNQQANHQSTETGKEEENARPASGKKPKPAEETPVEPAASGIKTDNQTQDNRTDKKPEENTNQPDPKNTEKGNNANAAQTNNDTDGGSPTNKKDDGIGR